MKNKKDIDRLFREKFRDFEQVPKEGVWQNIKEELQQKDNNKVTAWPLWSKIAGVAALVALLFLAGDYFLLNDNVSSLVKSSTEEKIESTSDKSRSQKNERSSGVVGKENEDSIKPSKGKEWVKQASDSTAKTTQKAIVSSDKKKKTTSDHQKEGKNAQEKYFSKRTKMEPVVYRGKAHDAPRLVNTLSKSANKEGQEESALIFRDKNKPDVSLLIGMAVDYADSQKWFVQVKKQRSQEQVGIDKELSALDEIAKAKENKDKASKNEQTSKSRLALRPNIAPVFYGSLKGGSAVDPQFSENTAKGETTMAYGLDLAYAVSDRVKLRTGIGQVNMSYNNHNVAFTSSPQAMELQAVHGNAVPQVLNDPQEPAAAGQALFAKKSAMTYVEGDINQELKYMEVPLELEYSILNERFGINLIGGASTLILNDDAVHIDSQLGSADLGRAVNINSLSFTTNIGLGFDYDLSETMMLNLEPTFKYQLNGFSGDTGGFRPYYFGIYSGVSFRF